MPWGLKSSVVAKISAGPLRNYPCCKIKVSWVCIVKSTCLISALCLKKVKPIEGKWPLKMM